MLLLLTLACHDSVTSEREAELAYIGFDAGVSRALDLGLQGFSLASSANLDPQSADGDEAGTMTIEGKADQGSSDNKGLRLYVALAEYADLADVDLDGDDDIYVVYDTEEEGPLDVDLQLRDMPDGTLSGTLVGTVMLSEDLEGPATFALNLDGATEADGDGLRRVAGSTHVTGTVTGPSGEDYAVDVMR